MRVREFLLLWCVLLASGSLHAKPSKTSAATISNNDVLLGALIGEIGETFQNLKSGENEPLYYLSYRVSDGVWFVDSASFGALETSPVTAPNEGEVETGRARHLYVSARVGSKELDNTHKVRDDYSFDRFHERSSLPIENDPAAIKVSLWKETDRAYQLAAKRLIQVQANRQVKVKERDNANDFSQESPHVYLGEVAPSLASQIDRREWQNRIRRLSAIFKDHPLILNSQVSLQGGSWTHYFVDTEGSKIREPRFFLRLMLGGTVKTDDGMDLYLYDEADAFSASELPSDAELEARIHKLIARLEALRIAPIIEPYVGPAIMTSRAAAVFFHEIFGHRVEGHRQKDEDEGRTFSQKVGQAVVPKFISVYDDPTLQRFGSLPLYGHYLFDDEGIPAQRVTLIKNGILEGFLMGRSPISEFPHSNGHGRAQPGLAPVSRQGNLLVKSTRRISFAELRSRLIAQVKKQKKPYGLIFHDISGGFTTTRTGEIPQAFKVIPLVVTRVFTDGRPDELVRGGDLVGTPLQSLEKILATGNDDQVFNGFCGAESGFVPVSATSPSLLLAEIEVERAAKNHDRPPLLSAPKLMESP